MQPTAHPDLFRNEGEYWTIAYAGLVCHLRDSSGLQHLAYLLRHAGTAVPALELVAARQHAASGSTISGDCRFSPDVGAIRESPRAAVRIRRAFPGGSRAAPTPEMSEPEKIDSPPRRGPG